LELRSPEINTGEIHMPEVYPTNTEHWWFLGRIVYEIVAQTADYSMDISRGAK